MTTSDDWKKRFGLYLVAAALAPILAMSVWLWISRHLRSIETRWDDFGLALSMIAGLWCLWRLPISIAKRAWITVVYVPFGVALLIFYSLGFVCAVFGDCL
jgi:hypothetical protein